MNKFIGQNKRIAYQMGYKEGFESGAREAIRKIAKTINNNSIGGVVKEKDILEKLELLQEK